MKSLSIFIERLGERRIVYAIALIAFAVQLIAMRAPEIYGEPYLVARNIIAGKGFSFVYPLCTRNETTCYVTPLYVFLELPFLLSSLGEKGIQIFNLILLQIACFATYRFFRRFTSSSVAVFVFAALSFYVPFWILANALEPNTLNILLIVLTVSVLYDLGTEPSRGKFAALGLLAGIQALVRPDILIGITLFAIWLLIQSAERKATFRSLLISAGICLLTVAPWTIRNYLEFQRFILVSANSGYNLYVGNNPVATGEFSESPATAESQAEYAAIIKYSEQHDQIQLDQFRLQLAENWMLHHPADVIVLDLKKFWFHWIGRSLVGGLYHFGESRLGEAFVALSVVLVLFGSFGLLRLPDRRLQTLLLTLFLYSTVVSMIFFVQSRHRTLKVDPFLVPLAVIGIVAVFQKKQLRSTTNSPARSYTMQEIIAE